LPLLIAAALFAGGTLAPAVAVPAPQAAAWLGRGHRVAEGDYWRMQNLKTAPVFARHMADTCFEENPCPDRGFFHDDEFDSVEAWSDYYSNELGVGASGGYNGFSATVESSTGVSVESSIQESRKLSYATATQQRKCYRLAADDHCAYNQSNLQSNLVEWLWVLPTGHPYTEQKMEAWRPLVERYGTHVAMKSFHGAFVQALVSSSSRSDVSSTCMDEDLCVTFGFADIASNNYCNKASSCANRTGSVQMKSKTCIALGGDPVLQSSICRSDVTQEILNGWLGGGDLQAGSSAFRYEFTPLPQLLGSMGPQFTEVSSTLAKAVEYSSCRITRDPNAEPIQHWSDTYGCQCQRKCPIGSKLDPVTCTCKCQRQCANGGSLDEETCTCSCRGNQQHGWKGPECKETYGSCQPGVNTGNDWAADECPISNECSSWLDKNVCQPTDVCCASNWGTKCCPFGSTCNCFATACECVAPGRSGRLASLALSNVTARASNVTTAELLP
jgi:hypothetical protein